VTKGYIFSEEEAKRVAGAVYANEGRPPHQLPPRPRPIRAGGGGGGDCTCQEIWTFLPLACSAGTWSIGLNVNGTTDTLTFNWNTSASAFDTELATHTNLTGSEYTVAGGDFPSVAIYVTWSSPADANVVGGFPTIDISSLTGNVTMYKFSTES